jgi:hypothetical protein
MVVLLAFLLGWAAAGLTLGIAARLDAATTQTSRVARKRLITALDRCEIRLVDARTELLSRPKDARRYLAVATWEMRRRNLLALVAEEARSTLGAAARDDEAAEQFARRAGAPEEREQSLVRATEAARAALRIGLPPAERLQAFVLISQAERALGHFAAEAAALQAAVELEPASGRLWAHLSEAYGRSRQFQRAEAARLRAVSLAEETR